MTIAQFIEALLEGRSPIEGYLLALLKKELGDVVPPVGAQLEIGEQKIRALKETWIVKLDAVREA